MNLQEQLSHYITAAFDNEKAFISRFISNEEVLRDLQEISSIHMSRGQTLVRIDVGWGDDVAEEVISTDEFIDWVDGMNKL